MNLIKAAETYQECKSTMSGEIMYLLKGNENPQKNINSLDNKHTYWGD